MRLQTKLVGGFCLVAFVTLLVSAIGYWQARTLAAALYEIGTVRLPSIRGLDLMHEAMTAIRGNERVLLHAGHDDTATTALLADLEHAWARADRGRVLFEPLPQTDEEAAVWRDFVPAWEQWRTDHDAVIALIVAGRAQADPAMLALARERSASSTAARAQAAADLLARVIAINERIVEEAQRRSVASREDLVRVQRLMLLSAFVGVLGAVGLGLILGRRLSRPISAMSEALGEVTRGDLSAHVDVKSDDEIGRMAGAINAMVESLRNSEARLRVLSDNLPDSVVYQIVREPDGSMRFLYASAGVLRLHGVLPGAVLRDASQIYRQVVPEDRGVIAAAEEVSLRQLRPLNVVVRIRRTDGEVRWMHICSAPRRLPDGRVLWDGFETDVTASRQVHEALRANEELLRQFVKFTPAAVAMFDHDMRYMQASDRWLLDYRLTNTEIIGRSHYDVFPEIPERWKEVHRRVLAGAVERCDEDPFPRADGAMEWLHWECRPWRDAAGGNAGLIMFTQVVTERKRTEQKLADQLAELRRWQQVTLGREDRIAQLKREVNELSAQLGRPPPYEASTLTVAAGRSA